MMTSKISWQTTVVMIVAIVAITATVLIGGWLGFDAQTMQGVIGGEGLIAAIVLGLMRPAWPRGGAEALLVVMIAAAAATLTGCAGGQPTTQSGMRVRDATCSGAAVVCRTVDRLCRATGGPAVIDSGGESP